MRSPARIAAIETELAKARDLEVAARTVLDDPEVVAVGEVETVDVDGPRGLALQCAEVVNATVAAASLAENRVSDLERFSGQLEKAYEAVAPERELHDELAALADVIAGKGQNSRKMSLRAYVLASRLEEIAVSASVRLQRMSGDGTSSCTVTRQDLGVAAAVWDSTSGTTSRASFARRRRSRAVNHSWRHCLWRSDSPMWLRRSPAESFSTRCSSTKDSAPSTPTPSIR